jgi:hypothetical protein
VTEDICSSCGAHVPGGRSGCQRLFDELGAAVYADVRRASVHDIAVDAYSMQHPEEYGRSAKSYAAHLMRLCCGVEHKGDAKTYETIRRWLDGRTGLDRPLPPAERGTITIADVVTQPIEGYADAVRDWAAQVWAAYSSQHALAREWINMARGHERQS